MTGLRLDRIGKSFGSHRVIEELSLELAPGGRLGLTGVSGCGKSTLLDMILGIQAPDRGRIIWTRNGRPVSRHEVRFSTAFQSPNLLPWLNAWQNMLYTLPRTMPREEGERRCRAALEAAGLAAFSRHLPGELSGGMKKRLGLVRALACPSDILVLDEPFESLDDTTREAMTGLVTRSLQEEPRTMILVSHHRESTLTLADCLQDLPRHAPHLQEKPQGCPAITRSTS